MTHPRFRRTSINDASSFPQNFWPIPPAFFTFSTFAHHDLSQFLTSPPPSPKTYCGVIYEWPQKCTMYIMVQLWKGILGYIIHIRYKSFHEWKLWRFLHESHSEKGPFLHYLNVGNLRRYFQFGLVLKKWTKWLTLNFSVLSKTLRDNDFSLPKRETGKRIQKFCADIT